jgi:hypothetical protein
LLNPRNLTNGQEQHEYFRDRIAKKRRCQYDYRHTDGELFSCVKLTLEACRQAKEKWNSKKNQPH